ncbi:hypothetical protein AaE_012192, partial [Aphanomyces astaci]
MGCADGLSRLPLEMQEDMKGGPGAVALRWDPEAEEFQTLPLPTGGPRVCAIAKGVVGAVTRSQSQATAAEDPPPYPPGKETPKEGRPEERETSPGPSGSSPGELQPYQDDTYTLPDAVLRREQARDPFGTAMKAYLEENALPLDPSLMRLVSRTSEHYSVKDGVLYRRVVLKSPLRNPHMNLVPVIPVAMTTGVLSLCHDSPLAGHFGRERTLER